MYYFIAKKLLNKQTGQLHLASVSAKLHLNEQLQLQLPEAERRFSFKTRLSDEMHVLESPVILDSCTEDSVSISINSKLESCCGSREPDAIAPQLLMQSMEADVCRPRDDRLLPSVLGAEMTPSSASRWKTLALSWLLGSCGWWDFEGD